jgi:two-component system sensor histidine kinase KdpD
VDDTFSLVLRGHPLAAADRRVVEAFAAQAAVALRQERLAEQAAAVGSLAEVDKMRTALLSAVSHDLRTPLASAKAAVDGLRSTDVAFSDSDRDELLATIGISLERLTRLVDNLLDMSRLQAGALGLHPEPMSMAEALNRAIDDLGADGTAVEVVLGRDEPDVYADPVLIERVLVNLLSNALRYSPAGRPPLVSISEHAGYVECRVIDHGPGIPATEWDNVFMPFQRLGDRDNDTGVGLGLALSRGLAEAMGGSLTPELTPGGGLTMTLRLPTAETVDLAEDEPADPALLARLEGWGEHR